ncbi:metal ABC transporter substrate-binding protein [Dysosmobacter sp.]|uniref:metal ABC transporter substrate-binding protein n=1 Tax=Dysosmobacter sp. TaxID=2591382 RepID=UPI002A9C7410|nr:metal ABC transporter substrate-binding protein [Dysosmobacter sp.]MDY5613325.1 metal ABC transporter substrate-binding protein [Dysosmobacter sp.]
MKKLMLCICCILLLVGCAPAAPAPEADEGRLRIVATVFPAYDFARAAVGDGAEVALLLPPGVESHSYEPTPADILAVQNCDLFIYLGGESDAWVDTILTAVQPRGETLRMVDCVDLLEEEHVEGMQAERGHDHDEDEHHEEPEEDSHGLGEVTGMDEHVWTSPANAAEITLAIGERLAELDSARKEAYRENAEAYAAELTDLDQRFEAFFDAQPSRTIVFGDRFPLRYFAERYDLDYYAAFPGCGTQTEPSAATIAYLTEKVRAEQLPTVWYIEFSNHLVADCIAEATGTQTAMFHTCHNVSKAEIESGATYLSLMERNLEVLQQYFA